MAKKLTKHGNSLALVIDKPILELLKISQKTELEIIIKGNSLIITPVKRKKKLEKNDIDDIADRIMEKYKSVFEKLAK